MKMVRFSDAPPYNGMHPTADTRDVIYFQSLVAAGEAGRWAAVESSVI